MHPFKLVMNRNQLKSNVIRVGEIGKKTQDIFERTFRLDHHSAIGASRLIKHNHEGISDPLRQDSSSKSV